MAVGAGPPGSPRAKATDHTWNWIMGTGRAEVRKWGQALTPARKAGKGQSTGAKKTLKDQDIRG